MSFILFCSISSVSADVYVNDTGGDDTNDGSSWLLAKKTIAAGLSAVENNGIVNLADGTYTGAGNTNLVISKNITIRGQTQNGTIINGTNSAQIFHIYPSDADVFIQNITFVNGRSTYGGAIANDGDCSISDCTFIGNTATRFGGAICNFEENLYVKNCIFIGNNAANGGGALGNIAGGNCVISGCTFLYNTATNLGGAIVNGGNMELHFNRIAGNNAASGNAFYQAGESTADVTKNWWGSNTDPTTITNLIVVAGGTLDADPWLIMTYSADPTTIEQGKTSTLTADFRYDSSGTLNDPAEGHLPDGTPVTFTTNLGNVGGKSTIVETLNGVAIAVLRADEGAGEALTSAILDSQTLTAPVTITEASVDPADPGNPAQPDNSVEEVNAASNTVGMQKTGIPVNYLILAILMVLGGLSGTKRK